MGAKSDYQLMRIQLQQGPESYRWGEKGNFRNCDVSGPTEAASLSKAVPLRQTLTLYCP